MKQFTTRTFLIITFFVAATALVLSLKVLGPTPPDKAMASMEREIDALQSRIDQLSSGLASGDNQGAGAFDGTDPVLRTDPLQAPAETDATTEARLQDLGESMEEVRWTMALRGISPPTSEHIRKARDLIHDPREDIRNKLAGLRLLRVSDELNDDDVRQMVAVFNETDDPRAQVGIIRLLDDVRTPEFLDTLMRVSSTSENTKVRKEAIDSLSGYLPDPDLKEWLEVVARDDPDKKVKREATRLLEKYWEPPSGG